MQYCGTRNRAGCGGLWSYCENAPCGSRVRSPAGEPGKVVGVSNQQNFGLELAPFQANQASSCRRIKDLPDLSGTLMDD